MPPKNPAPTTNAKPAKAAAIAVNVKPKKPGDAVTAAEQQNEEHMVPPLDTFWTRYSPNGEVYISPISSFIIHAMLLGFILLGVLSFFRSEDQVEEIEPVLVGDDTPGGGGGNVMGSNIGAPGLLSKKDDVSEDLKTDKTVKPDEPIDDPKVVAPKAPALPEDPDSATRIEKQKKQDANRGIYIKDALSGEAGKGKGGGGRGGGLGEGIGLGNGDKWGLGPSNRRGRRVERWEMLFNISGTEDYLRQLNALGCYIGIPDQNAKLMIVKNLNEKPAKWQYENLVEVNRIYWYDTRPESARGVAELLQMNVIPSMFVCFMPQTIEKELLRVEMAFAKNYGVTKEEDIKSTQFGVAFRSGKPVFTVKGQTRK